MCITDSCCCTPETNRVLHIYYAPTKFNFKKVKTKSLGWELIQYDWCPQKRGLWETDAQRARTRCEGEGGNR